MHQTEILNVPRKKRIVSKWNVKHSTPLGKSSMLMQRSKRSHLSYIDKSRNFYAAQGYEKPYKWAYHHEAPFTRLKKLLTEYAVGIVTTAYFPKGMEPDGVEATPPKKPYAAPSKPFPAELNTKELA
ncbi:MAG: hypothetical protein QF732_00040 [Nitrospinaceae bacterium]|nr:hypothetical protein [Nitrospinaceae bacterium]